MQATLLCSATPGWAWCRNSDNLCSPYGRCLEPGWICGINTKAPAFRKSRKRKRRSSLPSLAANNGQRCVKTYVLAVSKSIPTAPEIMFSPNSDKIWPEKGQPPSSTVKMESWHRFFSSLARTQVCWSMAKSATEVSGGYSNAASQIVHSPEKPRKRKLCSTARCVSCHLSRSFRYRHVVSNPERIQMHLGKASSSGCEMGCFKEP